jgi:hypothetical protein
MSGDTHTAAAGASLAPVTNQPRKMAPWTAPTVSATSPEFGAWIIAQIETPRQRQERILNERDGAVQEALATYYPGWCDYRAAPRLADELRQALRRDIATDDRARLLQRIVQLSGYKSLEARQITYIIKGRRS